MAVSVCLHALEYKFPLSTFFLKTEIIRGMHFSLCLHMIPWAAGDKNIDLPASALGLLGGVVCLPGDPATFVIIDT